jgi:hypothetical protein
MKIADPAQGLAADAKRRNRLSLILIGLMLVGGVVGFLSAIFEVEGGGFLEGIPAAWAIIASILMVGAVSYGSWRYNRATDELDRRDNLWASAVALHFYIVGYAGWYLWWRGGLVPEPAHGAMFVATMVVMGAAYAFKKIRP